MVPLEDRNKLTERQAQVLDFIKRFIASHRQSPTFQEISDHFGFTNNAAVCHVRLMEKKGWLEIRRNSGERGLAGKMHRGILLYGDAA